MTNFDLHERAQQLADTTSAYELARRLVEMEQEREEKRRLFVAACEVLGAIAERLGLEEDEDPDTIVSVLEGKLEDCEELTALKAALVDEGDEVPAGPALSLLEKLKGERGALKEYADKLRRAAFEVCNDEVSRRESVSRAVFAAMLESAGNRTPEGEPIDWLAEAALTPPPTIFRQDASTWSGWCCQYPGKMPRLYGSREIAELNHDPENGDRLFQVVEMSCRPGRPQGETNPRHQAAADAGFKGAPPDSDVFIRRLRGQHEGCCLPGKLSGGPYD